MAAPQGEVKSIKGQNTRASENKGRSKISLQHGQWLLLSWSLPTPEVYSSNPAIGKIYFEHCFEKTKKKKKDREWLI